MTTTAKPKTTAKTETEAFAFPAMPAMEVPPALRDMAESAAAQSKEAYTKFKTAAEDAGEVLEDTFVKTRAGVTEFNTKALEVAQKNTEAALAHMKNIFAVKSFSDAIELQSSFMKEQMAAFQDQSKTFQEMATKLTQETAAPYKAAFEKTVSTFKVA